LLKTDEPRFRKRRRWGHTPDQKKKKDSPRRLRFCSRTGPEERTTNLGKIHPFLSKKIRGKNQTQFGDDVEERGVSHRGKTTGQKTSSASEKRGVPRKDVTEWIQKKKWGRKQGERICEKTVSLDDDEKIQHQEVGKNMKPRATS